MLGNIVAKALELESSDSFGLRVTYRDCPHLQHQDASTRRIVGGNIPRTPYAGAVRHAAHPSGRSLAVHDGSPNGALPAVSASGSPCSCSQCSWTTAGIAASMQAGHRCSLLAGNGARHGPRAIPSPAANLMPSWALLVSLAGVAVGSGTVAFEGDLPLSEQAQLEHAVPSSCGTQRGGALRGPGLKAPSPRPSPSGAPGPR
jgi:hypothetical protein